MTSGALSEFPGSEPGFPVSFLPASGPQTGPAAPRDDLLAGELPAPNLPNFLAFEEPESPQWTGVPPSQEGVAQGAPQQPAVEEQNFAESYAQAFAGAKDRLEELMSGLDREKIESSQRKGRVELSMETLHLHVEQIGQVPTAGLPRQRLIRELERGLGALDAAEADLKRESVGAGLGSGRRKRSKPLPMMQKLLRVGGRVLQMAAFCLPLVIFAIVALILIGTALGWF